MRTFLFVTLIISISIFAISSYAFIQINNEIVHNFKEIEQNYKASSSGSHCPICFGSWGSGNHTEYEYIVFRCKECNVRWGNGKRPLSAAYWYCFYSSVVTNTQYKCHSCKHDS